MEICGWRRLGCVGLGSQCASDTLYLWPTSKQINHIYVNLYDMFDVTVCKYIYAQTKTKYIYIYRYCYVNRLWKYIGFVKKTTKNMGLSKRIVRLLRKMSRWEMGSRFVLNCFLAGSSVWKYLFKKNADLHYLARRQAMYLEAWSALP